MDSYIHIFFISRILLILIGSSIFIDDYVETILDSLSEKYNDFVTCSHPY